MKLYYHLNLDGFSNCYIVANEITNEAIIIDPGKLTNKIISQIEDNHYKLVAVLITHHHGSHVHGLETIRKIYNPKIYAADWDVARNDTIVINGDGKLKIAHMIVKHLAVPGHSTDSIVWGIENVLFMGDVLSAGKIGSTNSSYSDFILRTNLGKKILSQQEGIVLMPGHGPPTTLEAAKMFNINI